MVLFKGYIGTDTDLIVLIFWKVSNSVGDSYGFLKSIVFFLVFCFNSDTIIFKNISLTISGWIRLLVNCKIYYKVITVGNIH